jgi:hypothetical protein
VLLGLGGAAVWWMNQSEFTTVGDLLRASLGDSPGGTAADPGDDTQPHQVPPVIIQTGEPDAKNPDTRPRTNSEQQERRNPEQQERRNPEQQERRNPETARNRDTAVEPASGTATPAAAEPVSLRVLSSPEGAAVYFNDERKPRGKTPLKLSVPRGKAPVRVTLRLPGFREEVRRYVPDSNKEYDLQLRRDRRSGDRSGRNTGRNSDQQDQTGDTTRNNNNDRIEDDVGLEEPPIE